MTLRDECSVAEMDFLDYTVVMHVDGFKLASSECAAVAFVILAVDGP